LQDISIWRPVRFKPKTFTQKGSNTMFKNYLNQKFKLMIEGLKIAFIP